MKGHPTLNDRVRIERRADRVASDGHTWDELNERWLETAEDFDPSDDVAGDGAGNTKSDFVRIGPAVIRCEVRELDGGERVQAAKLQGTSTCLVLLRVSSLVGTVTTDDRLVQLLAAGAERVLNIRHAPPQDRGGYRTLLCDDGGVT